MKIGQKVRIKEHPLGRCGEPDCCYLLESMKNKVGRFGIIIESHRLSSLTIIYKLDIGDSLAYSPCMLEEVPMSLFDELEVGDLLQTRNEELEVRYVKVLAKTGLMVFLSYIGELGDKNLNKFSHEFSKEDFEKWGYKKPGKTTVTKQQIADKFETTVENLEII